MKCLPTEEILKKQINCMKNKRLMDEAYTSRTRRNLDKNMCDMPLTSDNLKRSIIDELDEMDFREIGKPIYE
jgi:hypothetical protein